MATLQDVQNAIDAVTAAELAEAQALEAFNLADAAVSAAIPSEIATYQAAVLVFDAARSTAQNNAGYPAALTALTDAQTARETALATARDVMLEFAQP